jgi:hypothetical protein
MDDAAADVVAEIAHAGAMCMTICFNVKAVRSSIRRPFSVCDC